MKKNALSFLSTLMRAVSCAIITGINVECRRHCSEESRINIWDK